MDTALSVAEFIAAVNGLLAQPAIVEGEVAGFSVSQGKWAFFTLKDQGAALSCFAPLYRLPFPLEDGMRLQAAGVPRVYEKSGRFSLVVERLELVGSGSLQRAYELLKKKLAAEGLFATEHKRPIPEFPERIGVIASADSAAWGDFKRILANRWGGIEVVLRPSLVQGSSAEADLLAAFADFNQSADKYDILVLIRGGGSIEDLAAFNSEALARAVYASRIPVVVGIGHERDETLVDFVADLRASTPSNAAELLVPERREFLNSLDATVELLGVRLDQLVQSRYRQLDHYGSRLLGATENLLWPLHHTLEKFPLILQKLSQLAAERLERLANAERLLGSFNPRQVLERGYSITRDKTGRVLTDAASVDKGDNLVIELSRGSLKSTVT